MGYATPARLRRVPGGSAHRAVRGAGTGTSGQRRRARRRTDASTSPWTRRRLLGAQLPTRLPRRMPACGTVPDVPSGAADGHARRVGDASPIHGDVARAATAISSRPMTACTRPRTRAPSRSSSTPRRPVDPAVTQTGGNGCVAYHACQRDCDRQPDAGHVSADGGPFTLARSHAGQRRAIRDGRVRRSRDGCGGNAPTPVSVTGTVLDPDRPPAPVSGDHDRSGAAEGDAQLGLRDG